MSGEQDPLVNIYPLFVSTILKQKLQVFLIKNSLFFDIFKIKDVNMGGLFGMALDENNILWGWGNNNSGELGIENIK